jgi:hypothetical protein
MWVTLFVACPRRLQIWRCASVDPRVGSHCTVDDILWAAMQSPFIRVEKNNSRLGEMGCGAGDAKVHAYSTSCGPPSRACLTAWGKTTWAGVRAVDSVDPITDGHDTGSAAQSVELSSPLTPASHQLPLPPALPTLPNPQSDPDLAGVPRLLRAATVALPSPARP